METDTYAHGVPSWVDLSAPDPAAAAAFYSALFGWEVQAGPPEFGGYAMAHLKGRTVAGIAPQQQPGPAFWATYVNVEDADAVAAAVSAHGGQVLVPPTDVMDAGRMAVFTDPQGAAFGIWQPGSHPGAGLVNEPGTLCWNELLTTDVAGASAFYSAVFGWGTHGHELSGYVEWQVRGRSIAGMMAKPPDMPAEAPPVWNVYFAVEDTDAAARRVQELGGSVAMGPIDIEPGRFAVVADPAGAVFSVIAMKV